MIYKSREEYPVNVNQIFELAKSKKRYINVKNSEIKAAGEGKGGSIETV